MKSNVMCTMYWKMYGNKDSTPHPFRIYEYDTFEAFEIQNRDTQILHAIIRLLLTIWRPLSISNGWENFRVIFRCRINGLTAATVLWQLMDLRWMESPAGYVTLWGALCVTPCMLYCRPNPFWNDTSQTGTHLLSNFMNRYDTLSNSSSSCQAVSSVILDYHADLTIRVSAYYSVFTQEFWRHLALNLADQYNKFRQW